METGILQSVKQFTLEKKKTKTKELAVLFSDSIGLQESAQWWCWHSTDCSWCRSLDRDGAPARHLNHPGLRLQRVPAAFLQDSTGSDGVLSCMRCALLKSLSYQVKLPRLCKVGEWMGISLQLLYEDLSEVIQKLHLSGWWLETRGFHQQKESSFYLWACGTEGHSPLVNIRPCNRIIEKL